MKNTKRLLALLLSIVMLLSFVGCDIDSSDYGQSSTIESSSSIIDDTSDNLSQITDSKDESSSTPSKDTSSTSAQTPSTTQKPNNSTVGTGTAKAVDPSTLPAYSGTAYTIVNNNQPNFSAAELTTKGYEKYSSLDSLGRCGVALASCGKEIMPGANEERGSISSIKPTGWIQKSYSGVSGGYLWNRCHLIGWQLSAENANRQNLITGTRYMNINGMLPFENMVADYIRETGNHVAYRITPIFEENNLVCSGVQMEAYSIEDEGESICFNVYCYNVQPGITINYATGDSSGPSNSATTSTPSTEKDNTNDNQAASGDMVWIPNSGSKYHSRSGCSNMKNPRQVTKQEAENEGYEPCKKCW
ncbi:MAG: DNA/RNA non-specific endonuclease [Oscillospiraceae bacterium]|nr:DNA/RNA non-specific endonuclease [Oscillospiraceae bacterium]